MSSTINIFFHLNNLTRNKVFPDFSLEEIQKTYEPFMVNRFFSMFDAFIPIIEIVNQMNLDKENHYRFLFNLLPQQSMSFNNYISKKKNELKEEEKKYLIKYFECGKNDLDCILDLLSQKQIDSIMSKYKDVGKVR